MVNNKKNKLGIFSFFSGAGFLDLGFEHAGYDVLYVNEIFKPFLDAYKYSRTNLKISEPKFGYAENDIKNVLSGNDRTQLSRDIKEARKTYNYIGFIGGPPCPDFSVAGKNKGRIGKNGTLSDVYVNLIIQQKPDFFLFENVKGLWKTKKHREFYEEFKARLQDSGYRTTERLINSIEYGAPQDRDRIILIGFRKEVVKRTDVLSGDSELRPDIFPWVKFIRSPRDEAFNLPWPTTDKFIENSISKIPKSIQAELTAEYWFQKNNVLRHANASHSFKPRAGLARFESVLEGDVSRKSYKRLHRWRYSPTVAYGNNEVHLHPYKSRRISVAEALALQSLPSNFTLPNSMTLSNMFKAVGNGVPYLAALGIAKTIKNFLSNE